MIALLALSLVSPVLTFSGGSDTVFLEFLVKAYHQPVVIFADAKRDWRKASVPATGISKSEQIDLLLKRIDGEPTRDGTLGVSRKAWPTAFHLLGWRGIYQVYAKRKVKTSEVDSSGWSAPIREVILR